MISDFAQEGGNILVSGAYIATDAWQEIYPVSMDARERKDYQSFIQSVLGYKWRSSYAAFDDQVLPARHSTRP